MMSYSYRGWTVPAVAAVDTGSEMAEWVGVDSKPAADRASGEIPSHLPPPKRYFVGRQPLNPFRRATR